MTATHAIPTSTHTYMGVEFKMIGEFVSHSAPHFAWSGHTLDGRINASSCDKKSVKRMIQKRIKKELSK